MYLTGDVGWGASVTDYFVGINWQLVWGFVVQPDENLVRATVFGRLLGFALLLVRFPRPGVRIDGRFALVVFDHVAAGFRV